DDEHGRIVWLLRRFFEAANGGFVMNPLIIVGEDEFHFSPLGTGEFIAADISIYPDEAYVQPPRIPYPGPPPGIKNGKPHARIVCEVGNKQSTSNWNAKCQLWLNQVYVRYVLGIKIHKKRNIRNDQGQYHRSMTARLWDQNGYLE
ncbi:2625_t:CDS:2, partial [Acaulospora morrowiae]